MNSQRSHVTGVAVLAVAGAAGLCLWAGGQRWFRGGGTSAGPATGADVTGALAQNLPTVVLLGCLLLLVFGRAGRRAMGLLSAGAGLWMAWLGFTAQPRTAAGDAPLARESERLDPATGWSLAYAALALMVVGAGAVLAVFPGDRRRFGGSRAQTDDPDAWTILDRGKDPTAL